MGGLISRRHAVAGARRQAAAFHNRERRKSLRDPAFGLHGTHVLTSADNPIDTDAVFPGTLLEPITFSCDVVRTDAASNGLLFEFGSSTRGIAAALDGEDLIVGAGAAGDDGATITATAALPRLDLGHGITVAAMPGQGLLLAWVDGQLVGRVASVNGDFGGGWSDDEDGAVEDAAGTVTARIPAPQAVALSDAMLVSPLRAFFNQRPRQVT